MKDNFDRVSGATSRLVTVAYSTSFSAAVKLLSPAIRQDIYNIYGFVRLADEVVDSFTGYDQQALFHRLKEDLTSCMEDRISLNPVLNAFQQTAHKYDIPQDLVDSFLESMEYDLYKKTYTSQQELRQYIYGSADVVGLVCLQVFVKGDAKKFESLKRSAMHLGSAFQKINFLRDFKDDTERLGRLYFHNLSQENLQEQSKQKIISDIEEDLRIGYLGILELPIDAKLGVYLAYVYYRKLLAKLKRVSSAKILKNRIRIPNYQKAVLFAKCYVDCKLHLV